MKMDSRVQELADLAKEKFGLGNYYLARHHFYRSVHYINDTVYTVSMEWFPNHVTEPQDDESNPEGAAGIEINIQTHRVERAIFVRGQTYAKDGVLFATLDRASIIEWVERETGLKYGEQFDIQKESEGELQFRGCFNGVALSPGGSIDVKYNHDGMLTSFFIDGHFPTKEMVKEEKFSLTLEQIEHLTKKQLQFIEAPLYKQKRFVSFYGIEEIYVKNDGMSTISFDIMVDKKSLITIERIIEWHEASHNTPFTKKEISLMENLTAEQAFSCEPSPDSFPITFEEKEQCVMAVEEFLRQEFPNDSGQWTLKALHRSRGYILATLRANNQDHRVFQRKMQVWIDATSLQVLNYMDNLSMLEILQQFQIPDKTMITKEQAYDKLKPFFELKPTYVLDVEQQLYVLCGKLDCHYGVDAVSGKVALLNDF